MHCKHLILSVLSSLALLSGCGAAIPADRLSQARTVGAISLLGDWIDIVQIGTISVNNVHRREKVAPAIDRIAVDRLKSDIARKTKLRFVAVDYQYSDFAPIYRSTSRFPDADYDLGYAREMLTGVRNKYGIDLLILVLKARREADADGHYISGYGLFGRSFFGVEADVRAALGADIAVVDMKDFKILSVVSITRWRDLEKNLWKDIGDYKPDELKSLATFYRTTLESEIDRALDQFGLISSAKP
jgi:hypothetical protein